MKVTKYILFVWLALAARFCTASPIYYTVAVNGNDQNSGTSNNPFKTIAHALSLSRPGTIIRLRGGVYHQRIIFQVSGLPGKPVVVTAYPHEHAVIDGNNLIASSNDALIRLSHVHWVTVKGLELRNFQTMAKQTVVNAITVDSGSTHIQLLGNHIHDIGNLAVVPLDRSAHAIWVIGNTDSVVAFISIAHNKVYRCKTGYSENVTINGYVRHFVVEYNTITNAENIGIDAAGGYHANADSALNYARYGTISYNKVMIINNSHGAPGIYVDGARDITVAHNEVAHCFRGIGVLSENTGYPARDCVVYDNYIHNNQNAGLYIGGYEGQSGGGGTIHCRLTYNRLVNNNQGKGVFGELEGEIRIKLHCDSNLIACNRIRGQMGKCLFINKPNPDGKINVIRNNRYEAPGNKSSWNWNGKLFTNFRQWCLASNDHHSSLYIHQ